MTQASGPPRDSFGFDVRFDPWAVEYGAETPTEFLPAAEDTSTVDVSVEVGDQPWGPISPSDVATNQTAFFVDGVRRMEARLPFKLNGHAGREASGTFCTGVRCSVS